MIIDENTTKEEILAGVSKTIQFFRDSVRMYGAGPQKGYWTGDGERIFINEGEDLIDAMVDHPSPVVAYVGRTGQWWTDVDVWHTPMGNQACYSNARYIASRTGGKYVEGWAVHRWLPDTLVRHAWVLTPEGRPLEVTWDGPATDYVGIVFRSLPKKDGMTIITDEWALNRL